MRNLKIYAIYCVIVLVVVVVVITPVAIVEIVVVVLVAHSFIVLDAHGRMTYVYNVTVRIISAFYQRR